MNNTGNSSTHVDTTPVGQLLLRQARRDAEALALLEPGFQAMSYAQLQSAVASLQRQLRAGGVQREHRLALVMPNSSATVTVILGLLDSCTLVPLNPDYRQREYDALYQRIRVDAVVTSYDAAHPCQQSARASGIDIVGVTATRQAGGVTLNLQPSTLLRAPENCDSVETAAMVLHTSGSTASPKIVPLRHSNLLASIDNLVTSLALTESDRCLNMMPMFHIGAIVDLTLASLAVGASMVTPATNNAETFFRCLHEYRPSWYQGVPTMLRDIVSHLDTNPGQLDQDNSLRLLRSVSSALPNRLLHEVENKLDTRVIEIYGMTESAGLICSNPLAAGRQKQGSVGLPQGCEVRVVDSTGNAMATGERGEVIVRGDNVMSAYEDRDDAAQDFIDGFFRTGDEAYFDSEGYLFLCGRIKEIINRGGEKISPLEIDRVAETHASVKAAAAFAIPHPGLGEEVGLAIIPAERNRYDETELLEYLGANLSAHKLPRRIFYPERLPRAAGGKLRRQLLAQEAREAEATAARQPWIAPQSPLARELAQLWSTATEVERISMHDNFFDLGGDSLGAAAVISKLKQRYPDVQPSVLYEHPSLQQLEQHLLSLGTTGPAGDSSMIPAADIHTTLQPFMSAWRGSRLDGEALIVGRHCDGNRTPLFWCVNGYSEFDALAELMEPEQPIYGMRSLFDSGLKSDAATLRLAMMYFDELHRIQAKGPYLLGGFCEGGKIAFLLAQMLRDCDETVASLMLHEQFVASPYSGRVAIFICRPGRNNPYYNYADATRGWRKFYAGEIQLYQTNGRHKDCYKSPDIELVSRQLRREMQRALLGKHDDSLDRRNQLQRLPLDAYRAELRAQPPTRLRPGARFNVDVEITNRSPFDWMPTALSGLVLGAKWLKLSGETRQWMAGVSDLNFALHPGDSVTIPLALRAPFRLQSHYLELDLVDDGVSWFGDMGSSASRHRIDIRVF